jgi:hypothetical protein
MEWIDFGYDLRVPFSSESRWKVGDLDFRSFSRLLGAQSERVERIISFDLNLSPRPGAALSNRLGAADLAYGAYASAASALEVCGGADCVGRLLYWQIERQSYARAQAERWFTFMPDESTPLPGGWRCIGLDVVNDQGLSEYWDVAEAFWELDARLVTAVSRDGLIENEQLLTEMLSSLPLDPANRWVMPIRAWIAS